MQSAKDSFYSALRDRLAVVNPGRSVTLQGVARPAIFVAENEPIISAAPPAECSLRLQALPPTSNRRMTIDALIIGTLCQDSLLPMPLLLCDCPHPIDPIEDIDHVGN